MRKLITITAGILSFISLQAQLYPGIKAGVNFSTAEAKGYWKNKMRPGINFGGLILFPVSKNFFIQPEILYSLKGYKFTSSGNAFTGTATLNYLNIPVLFGFTESGNSNNALSIYTGPEIGFLLSGKNKKSYIYTGNSEDDLKLFFRKRDIGIVLGAALQFGKEIGIEARYSYGLTDLGGITYFDLPGNPIVKQKEGGNRAFQLGVFYLLRKKN